MNIASIQSEPALEICKGYFRHPLRENVPGIFPTHSHFARGSHNPRTLAGMIDVLPIPITTRGTTTSC